MAMFIYNITSQLVPDIEQEWLSWMQEEHIPEVLATGHFTHHRILRLREPSEQGVPTFAVQYFCGNREQYDHYIEYHAAGLRKKAQEKWGDRTISFRTLMEVIN
jgi:hypothetical protein